MSDNIGVMAKMLLAKAREHYMTIAVAESLTGGLLASSLVDIPGASDAFLGGIVTYTNDMKTLQLGVDPELLANKGAVCAEVAEQMTAGLVERFGATICLSTTGVAGPGPSEGKPAGTVFIACRISGITRVEEYLFDGDRGDIRRQTVAAALALANRSITF